VFGFSNPDISPGTVTASINTFEGETIVWILAGLSIGALAIGLFSWLKENVIAIMVVAGIAVLIGMWLERWNIIVPTMTHPRLIPYGSYTPSMTEIALTSASIALFMLFIMIFFKLFPAVSIWEIAEGRIVEAANAEISIPLPESSKREPRRRRWKFR
jgi:Ni/Fe-hydrogenase subunit HybB-like protein